MVNNSDFIENYGMLMWYEWDIMEYWWVYL